jgi:hypothetical protein
MHYTADKYILSLKAEKGFFHPCIDHLQNLECTSQILPHLNDAFWTRIDAGDEGQRI